MESDDAYLLTTAQKERFSADGHILLRSVAGPAEAASFPAIRETALGYNTETRSLADRDTYGKAFLQTTNLWQRNELVRKFVCSQRFARIAAELLEVESVRLYHDQALFKEAGGGSTPWHQDQYYWPFDTDKIVTMWMPMVDVDETMGMITFASGSHGHGPVGSVEISDESEDIYRAYIADQGFSLASADQMAAGDATFHAGWTIHSAGANHSQTTREVMTIIYFDGEASVAAPTNQHQADDLAAWLGGRAAGEVADSPLNPVLYDRGISDT